MPSLRKFLGLSDTLWGLIFLLISMLLIWLGYARAFFALRGVEQPLILRFNQISGITHIGTLKELLAFAILGSLMVLLDVVLGLTLKERSPWWARVLFLGGFLIALLIFLSCMAIMSVNS